MAMSVARYISVIRGESKLELADPNNRIPFRYKCIHGVSTIMSHSFPLRYTKVIFTLGILRWYAVNLKENFARKFCLKRTKFIGEIK